MADATRLQAMKASLSRSAAGFEWPLAPHTTDLWIKPRQQAHRSLKHTTYKHT
jgi:hypothetical protein